MKKYLLISLLLLSVHGIAQKKPITHADYDRWNWIKGRQISNDGNWIAYIIGPQKGDDTLYVESFDGKVKTKIARGTSAQFSYDSKILRFTLKPSLKAIEEAEAKKAPRIADTTALLSLATNQITRFPNIENFKFPEENGSFYGYFRKNNESKDLVIKNAISGKEQIIAKAEDFMFNKQGTQVVVKLPDSIKKFKLVRLNLLKSTKSELPYRFSKLDKLSFDEQGKQLAFLADTSNAGKSVQVWLASDFDNAHPVIVTNQKGLLPGFEVNEHTQLRFNTPGDRLLFSVQLTPPAEKLPEKTTANVEVWNYQDETLMSQQNKELAQLYRKPFSAVYFIPEQRTLQVMNENDDDVEYDLTGTGNCALVLQTKDGRRQSQWQEFVLSSAYIVALKDGSRKRVHHLGAVYSYQEHKAKSTRLSPGGKYVTWMDPEKLQYYAFEVGTGITRVISEGVTESLADLDEGVVPRTNYGRSIAFWTENDEKLFVHGNRDIWKLDPSGKTKPLNFTHNIGSANNIRFDYYVPFYSEGYLVKKGEKVLMTAFNYVNKHAGFYAKAPGDNNKPEKLSMGPYAYRAPGTLKALHANRYLSSRGDVNSYELYKTSDLKAFQKVTSQNPQQKEFNWYTSELIAWKSYNGTPMEGLLHKPENFDPTKKYPLIVYFYEFDSKNLYEHRHPGPIFTILNVPYYTSNGYLVFMPDVKYTLGEPGESAYRSVMSGIDKLKQHAWVDSTRMGIQGHSWGAYQDLYLITRTNQFKAASIGAPVGNMVSAYGSLRGTSGNSRHWVYESSQSRLGKTLWEAPDLYIKNSPVFKLDKITTPLMIMHNDQDQNVPFAQGFELFTGLRRLNKPTWMVNYTGEQHVLRNRVNMMDYSIRMQQFFDHYLKGAPAPVWMTDGIPAKMKNYSLGLEINSKARQSAK